MHIYKHIEKIGNNVHTFIQRISSTTCCTVIDLLFWRTPWRAGAGISFTLAVAISLDTAVYSMMFGPTPTVKICDPSSVVTQSSCTNCSCLSTYYKYMIVDKFPGIYFQMKVRIIIVNISGFILFLALPVIFHDFKWPKSAIPWPFGRFFESEH